MFRLFECCALSFFERFVLSFSLKIERFVSDSAEIWICGLYMGAGGKVTGKRSTAVCKFLGDISYPVYITHYPLVYTYTAWVCNNNATLAEGIPYMILTFAGAFVLAYACLKLYDEPIRKWLTD